MPRLGPDVWSRVALGRSTERSRTRPQAMRPRAPGRDHAGVRTSLRHESPLGALRRGALPKRPGASSGSAWWRRRQPRSRATKQAAGRTRSRMSSSVTPVAGLRGRWGLRRQRLGAGRAYRRRQVEVPGQREAERGRSPADARLQRDPRVAASGAGVPPCRRPTIRPGSFAGRAHVCDVAQVALVDAEGASVRRALAQVARLLDGGETKPSSVGALD